MHGAEKSSVYNNSEMILLRMQRENILENYDVTGNNYMYVIWNATNIICESIIFHDALIWNYGFLLTKRDDIDHWSSEQLFDKNYRIFFKFEYIIQFTPIQVDKVFSSAHCIFGYCLSTSYTRHVHRRV